MFWKVFSSIIVPLFILVPIVIGSLKIKTLPFNLKIIWFYLLITAVISTSATIIGRIFHSNNMPLLHLFTLIEGVMFIWFYKCLSQSNKKNKWFIFLQTGFVIICMLFALNFFANIAASDTKPLKLPAFYFNTGIFLYFSGSFILFIFSNFILQKLSASDMLIFWSSHSTLVLLMYIFFSTGFILCKK